MKLGARIFKTGIAITLALYLASWLGWKADDSSKN
ncbi:aromatic acid exporter family protein, partial [Bacillus licheniformis]